MRTRKRTAAFVKFQKELDPTKRVGRLKHFSNTRWTSHGHVIDVVYFKYEALIKTLDLLKK